MKTEELIAELEAVMQASGPDDALTTDQLCDEMNLGEDAVRRRLKALKKAGRLETVRRLDESLSGRPIWKTAYRVLPA